MRFIWLSSVAPSCATRDASNEDNVCKPTIPAGINRPPPSETISHVTRVPTHETRLARLNYSYLFRPKDLVGKCLFIYDGKVGRRIWSTTEGEESPWEGSWSDGTGHRSDPTNETSEPALRTPSTGVDAMPRRVIGFSWERE